MASGRSGRLGYAVCQLRQAESLILYSDHLLKDDKQNSIPRNRAAKVKLDRAEEALQQSRDILVCERRNVWWWTLMYLIESQLRHDQVALSLLPLVVLEKNAITEPEQELRRSKSRKQRNWTIRKGLRALSAGLDNNGRDSKIEDRVRREQFLQLWWRFCICHCASYVEHHETGDEEVWHDEWKKINLETDLSWLWKSQTTTHRDKYQEIFPDMHKQIHDLADESKMLDRKQLLDFETHFLNNIEPKVTSKTEEGQVT